MFDCSFESQRIENESKTGNFQFIYIYFNMYISYNLCYVYFNMTDKG